MKENIPKEGCVCKACGQIQRRECARRESGEEELKVVTLLWLLNNLKENMT
jgi:hypothetical protein